MSLKGKRILITAGPTWVPIDSVRVISNIATGRTGMLLAQEASNHGARVTLVLGPRNICNSLGGSIRIVRFCFFKELKNTLRRELQNKKYDIIIHSAAVSDFKPEHKIKGKLNSDRDHSLKLLPLEKLVSLINQISRQAKFVIFKLESAVADRMLIKSAKSAGEKAKADLVVANRLNPYRAFIIDRNGSRILAKNKQDLSKKLIKVLMKD